MAQPHWWVQSDGKILGPLTAARIRQLAVERKIAPSTMISRDGSQWMPAAKVRGLFPETEDIAPETDQVPRVRHGERTSQDKSVSETNPAHSLNGEFDQLLPLIRVTRKWWRTEVLAVYESHIATGTRNWTELVFTEEMCSPDGEQALTNACQRVNRLRFGQVQRVREEVQTFGSRAPGSLNRHRFELVSDNQRLTFSLLSDQVRHVRQCLAHRTGDRYQWRVHTPTPWKMLGGLISVLACVPVIGYLIDPIVAAVGFAVVLAACVGVYLYHSRQGAPWQEGIPPAEAPAEPPPAASNPFVQVLGLGIGFVAVGIPLCWLAPAIGGAWCLIGTVGVAYAGIGLCRAVVKSNSTRNATDSPAQKTPVEQPFRSAFVGWTLKAVGLAYWVMMASPLSDGISVFLTSLKIGAYEGLAWVFLSAPSALLIYCGYCLCQQPVRSESESGQDQFILFLRPFTEDGVVTLQPGGWASNFAGLRGSPIDAFQYLDEITRPESARISSESVFELHPVKLSRMIFNLGAGTAEEALVRYLDQVAPVRAIGKPGEFLATPGARRAYLSHGTWETKVRVDIAEALAVVMQPGSTKGVAWELQQVCELKSPQQVLRSRVSFWREPQAYEEMARLLRQKTSIRLPRVVPYLPAPAFIYFWEGWLPQVQMVSYRCPLLWPLTGNGANLDHSLRPFLKGLDRKQGSNGLDRKKGSKPRKPRWISGNGARAASFASLFVSLAVSILPVAGVDYGLRSLFTQSEVVTTWATLHGKTLPYSISVPSDWVEREPTSDTCEHSFSSPDGLQLMLVSVSDFNQDASHVVLGLDRDPTRSLWTDTQLESTTTVQAAGVEWAQAHWLATRAVDGIRFRQTMRAFSDDRGTINIKVLDAVNREQTTPPVTDQILASITLGPPPEPEVVDWSAVPLMTLKGQALPYSLTVPETLQPVDREQLVAQDSTVPFPEFLLRSPDEHFLLNVTVTTPPEDVELSSGEHLRREMEEMFPTGECRLESPARPFEVIDVAGVKWWETRYQLRVVPQQLMQRCRTRVFSDDRGTVIINVAESVRGSATYSNVADQILASLRVEEITTGNTTIVGTWESVGFSVRVVQEFTPDGISRISMAGVTLTGHYQMNGNVIEWSSGTTSSRVTVTFSSPTEMELRDEAGLAVRYRKTGTFDPPEDTDPPILADTTDVLKLIDPRRDAVAGHWRFDGTSLITGAQPRDRLELPCQVPPEYRLTMVASCRAHREALQIGLVAGSSQVVAILDGWSSTASCLGTIDGTDGVQFPTTFRQRILQDGKPNLIVCDVHKNRIEVTCNGTRVIDWTGDFSRLSMDPAWRVRRNNSLFIGSWDTPFEIRKLELTPL